ncbi:hypothetical protein L6164_009202 [Bauhinia variegata]|uniref:Uncharacterized protein n=1 Tax=Bauhinia variegata TaxID=167791 RepID=A0ACB9PLX3_BAUVA|nr:hypothetical protein L6164_009202 [Bauhinia variegata]
MNQDAMNVDQPQATTEAQTLQSLTGGSLSSSVAKLSGSSRCIPSDKDFHFYYNFDEFKNPIDEITKKSQSMLETIGSSAHMWGNEMTFPMDIDDAYEWLVNVNDEVYERFDLSVDEFQRIRKKEEEVGRPLNYLGDLENGFQLVSGKKKKGMSHPEAGEEQQQYSTPASGIKVATKDKRTTGPKPKVPFHIPTIKRPQDEYNILVNNSNQPFEHVWLQKSDDGQRFIHPLEKHSVLGFVDKDLGDVEPIKPLSIECTPFKLVEDVKSLKELASKLRAVNEFAVDLEHNQYRSFQGLTCLMQISTRTEDFVVDTLKLRIHIGPYLREVFKDPTKRKAMHGADRDIMWLQRDFGIYICNLFDTGQASRVLKLERNSLEHLLHHFCDVIANKEYQNADWRLRPLPDEMIRYAREDTHYLLYIYDLMRIQLFALPKESESSDIPLVEVYKRSYDVCMQLYEKELLTENSYLHIYGLPGAGFDAQQLAIVSGLCEWRDAVARAEDESTGYVLPNKTLLELAKQMPVTTSKLRRLVKTKHPYLECNLDTVVSIIRHSMQNAAAFEAAAQHLKEGRSITVSDAITAEDGTGTPLHDTPILKAANAIKGGGVVNPRGVNISEKSPSFDREESSFQHQDKTGQVKIVSNHLRKEFPIDSLNVGAPSTAKGTGATVQVARKPTGAFGVLLGNSSSKRKLDTHKKEEVKLDQIRSSVTLPFHSFLGGNETSKVVVQTPGTTSEMSEPQKPVSDKVSTPILDEIIMLDDGTDPENETHKNLESTNDCRENNSLVFASGKEDEEEPMSLSELSSNFQKCFQSNNQNSKAKQTKKTDEPSGLLQLKPFDYEEARKLVKFGEDAEVSQGDDGLAPVRDSVGKKKSSVTGRGQTSDLAKELQQGRRRQAFPASGNRSATFR